MADIAFKFCVVEGYFNFSRQCSLPSKSQRLVFDFATTHSGAIHTASKTAFPFAISKEDAITRLGPFTSFQAAGKGLLGSLGARYLPGFGFKSFEPVQSQAAYLPVWMIDAEVEAKVWLPQKSGADPSPVR